MYSRLTVLSKPSGIDPDPDFISKTLCMVFLRKNLRKDVRSTPVYSKSGALKFHIMNFFPRLKEIYSFNS